MFSSRKKKCDSSPRSSALALITSAMGAYCNFFQNLFNICELFHFHRLSSKSILLSDHQGALHCTYEPDSIKKKDGQAEREKESLRMFPPLPGYLYPPHCSGSHPPTFYIPFPRLQEEGGSHQPRGDVNQYRVGRDKMQNAFGAPNVCLLPSEIPYSFTAQLQASEDWPFWAPTAHQSADNSAI